MFCRQQVRKHGVPTIFSGRQLALVASMEYTMSMDTLQSKHIATSPSVSDVLDLAWLEEGMSPHEIGINKRLANIFDQLLVSGRTSEEINAVWETKAVA